MDELEFRQRVYANPADPGQEALDAAKEKPALQRILDQARMLDDNVKGLVNSVVVPADLAERLRNLPETAEEDTNVAATGATGATAANDAHSGSLFKYYALAACLLVAIAVTFTLGDRRAQLTPGDVAFGNDVLRHLLVEAAELSAINAGTMQSEVGMPEVEQLINLQGAQLVSYEAFENMPVRVAKLCPVLESQNGVHLMIQGNSGAVNIIVISNSPVSTQFDISDDRFNGRVIPGERGNVVLVGERDEDLETIETLFADQMNWAI